MNSFITTCVGFDDPVKYDELYATVSALPDQDVLLRVSNGRRKQFCMDALARVGELSDAQEYLCLTAAPFFDDVNTLGEFLDGYKQLDMHPRLFSACTTIPGVTYTQIKIAAELVPKTRPGNDADPKITARYPFYVLRYAHRNSVGIQFALDTCKGFTSVSQFDATFTPQDSRPPPPPPKRNRRVKFECEQCEVNGPCDAFQCIRTPETMDVHGVRHTFVCNQELGHLCRPCSVQISQKSLKTGIKKVMMQNGDMMFHIPLQWYAFDVEVDGVIHHVDGTGSKVITDLCDPAPTASVKVFVRAHMDETRTSYLRIGPSTPDTVWQIDVETIRLIREPHILGMGGRVFAVQTDTGKMDADASGIFFISRGLGIDESKKIKSTSVVIKTILEPVADYVDLDDQSYVKNSKLRAYVNERRVYRRFLSMGSTTSEIEFEILSYE